MKRRIKKATVRFISLVPQGANKLPVIVKEDGYFEVGLLTKANEEKRELLALVYAPEFRDSQGDIASAEVVKEMAHSFQKGGGQLDIRHDGKPLERDKAFVAETFIVQKNDPRFDGFQDRDGNPVNSEGAWGVVIKIEDDSIWNLYKEGGWAGVSLAGTAQMETEKGEDSQTLMQFVKSLFNGEKKMTKELKKDLEDLKTSFQELAEVVKGLVAKKDEPKEKEEPKDELKDVSKDEEKEALKSELSELKEKLAKFEKASNQDPENAKGDTPEILGYELTKEEAAAVARARKVAEVINKKGQK